MGWRRGGGRRIGLARGVECLVGLQNLAAGARKVHTYGRGRGVEFRGDGFKTRAFVVAAAQNQLLFRGERLRYQPLHLLPSLLRFRLSLLPFPFGRFAAPECFGAILNVERRCAFAEDVNADVSCRGGEDGSRSPIVADIAAARPHTAESILHRIFGLHPIAQNALCHLQQPLPHFAKGIDQYTIASRLPRWRAAIVDRRLGRGEGGMMCGHRMDGR